MLEFIIESSPSEKPSGHQKHYKAATSLIVLVHWPRIRAVMDSIPAPELSSRVRISALTCLWMTSFEPKLIFYSIFLALARFDGTTIESKPQWRHTTMIWGTFWWQDNDMRSITSKASSYFSFFSCVIFLKCSITSNIPSFIKILSWIISCKLSYLQQYCVATSRK